MHNKNMTSLLSKFVIFNFLISTLFMLTGCDANGRYSPPPQPTPAPTKQLAAIQVAPQATALPKGTTQEQLPQGLNAQYEATLVYNDGSSELATDKVSWSASNDNASVSASGLVTALHSGEVSIQATLDGVSGQRALTVVDALLTSIELTPATTMQLPKGMTQAWQALGHYSDRTSLDITSNVSWSSGNSAVATIDNAGLATAVAVGTTDIAATLDGISASAPLEVTAAKLTGITLSPANNQLAKGLTQQYSALASFTDGSSQDVTQQVSWSSDATAVAGIDTSGLTTAATVGQADISATLDGISASTRLEVTAAELLTLNLTLVNGSLAKGLTQQYRAQGVFTDGPRDITTSVSWSSSNPAAASIDTTTGLITAVDMGTTTITAMFGQIGASTKLDVTAATLTSIELTPANVQLAEGFSQQYSAQGTFSDGTQQDITSQVIWNSSNPAVASITPDGLATAMNTIGITEIGAMLDGISDNVTLGVNATLSAITVAPANTKIAKGASKVYSVQGTFTDGSQHPLTNGVIWSSTDDSVATIDATGLATALEVGTTQIGAKLGVLSANSTLEVVPATRVVTWGNSINGGDSSAVQAQLTDVQAIFSNKNAFAALKYDGSVVAWGNGNYGGNSSTVETQLTGVQTIFSTNGAFAALKADGSVVTWGDSNYGGDSSSVQAGLENVQRIASTSSAFAALKDDGSVVTWGNNTNGGDSSSVSTQLNGVITIFSNAFAFSAVKADGSVVTWGDSNNGGDSSAVKTDLTNVLTIQSNQDDYSLASSAGGAFAALKNDGSVVTWGSSNTGGNSSSVQNQLDGIKAIFSTDFAFSAIKAADGSVVSWGNGFYGGDSNTVASQLTGVKSIFSTNRAFAALKDDGSVVTWGASPEGGDSGSVQGKLVDIQIIFSTENAFAALDKNNKVVTWGFPTQGGDSDAVQSQLTDVGTITSTRNAFAALKNDGSVVTWGDSNYGGSSSAVEDQLTNVQTIVSNGYAFAAIALQ